MKKILLLSLSILLASCTTTPIKDTKAVNSENARVVGIWAMMPLRNGIANVIEFTNEGKSNLHSFNCNEKSTNEVESSTYAVSEDRTKILFKSGGETEDLQIIGISEKAMILGQLVGSEVLKFSYVRTSRVAPLCFLYKEPKEDKFKRTAFKESDFTHDPWIPEIPNIERYVGKWASDEGAVQIEVKRDSNNKYKVFLESNENWNYLYNNVRWSGLELRFKSFAYSSKRDLFDHPFHKSVGDNMLAPVEDANKIKWSFFTEGQQFDYILIRKK
jgi:hypothetical protein